MGRTMTKMVLIGLVPVLVLVVVQQIQLAVSFG